MIREVGVAFCLLCGVGFVLLAALGALRFPDALTRMAAVSKASTLGLTFIFLAVILQSQNVGDMSKAFLTIAVLWLSAPIAAHLLGRAAVKAGERLCQQTKGTHLVDEIKL